MNYLLARLAEPSTYVGIGLFALTGGSMEWTLLSNIDWTQVLSLAASVAAIALREGR